jgi:hypothetical protein
MTTALRFSIEAPTAQPRENEFYYRIELADGREALILACDLTVTASGALVAIDRWPANPEIGRLEGYERPSLVLAAGTWVSAYICEALFASDPGAILHLEAPAKTSKP